MADEQRPSEEKSPYGGFEQEPIREREASRRRFPIRSQAQGFVVVLLLVAVAGAAAISTSDGGGDASEVPPPATTTDPGPSTPPAHTDCVEHAGAKGDLCDVLLRKEAQVGTLYMDCRELLAQDAPLRCAAWADCVAVRARRRCTQLARRPAAAEAYLRCRDADRPRCLRDAALN
jgi:hypothetical protein